MAPARRNAEKMRLPATTSIDHRPSTIDHRHSDNTCYRYVGVVDRYYQPIYHHSSNPPFDTFFRSHRTHPTTKKRKELLLDSPSIDRSISRCRCGGGLGSIFTNERQQQQHVFTIHHVLGESFMWWFFP